MCVCVTVFHCSPLTVQVHKIVMAEMVKVSATIAAATVTFLASLPGLLLLLLL